MWTKIKAFHWNSLTVAWSHFLMWVGLAQEALYQFPDVAQQVGLASVVPPSYLGHYTLGIAFLTLGARMRTLKRDPQ
jgi:hypothetical protein